MNHALPLQLQVVEFPSVSGTHQVLQITLLEPSELIPPDVLPFLELPAELDFNRGVILDGQAPNWLYAHLVDRCGEAPWVACNAIQLNAGVVVASQVNSPQIGDLVSLVSDRPPGVAILIGGPPNSGKSVLSNALRCSLQKRIPALKVYLHRANWDGEGNWWHEMKLRDLAVQITEENKFKLHLLPNAQQLINDYFKYHARAVGNIRKRVDVVLVDIGGVPQPEKLPVLEQCSHSIIISNSAERVGEWYQFFDEVLKPLAVIHSVLDLQSQALQTEPYLEIVAGPWITGETLAVPECLLDKIVNSLVSELPHLNS